jgi:hypothetical protein
MYCSRIYSLGSRIYSWVPAFTPWVPVFTPCVPVFTPWVPAFIPKSYSLEPKPEPYGHGPALAPGPGLGPGPCPRPGFDPGPGPVLGHGWGAAWRGGVRWGCVGPLGAHGRVAPGSAQVPTRVLRKAPWRSWFVFGLRFVNHGGGGSIPGCAPQPRAHENQHPERDRHLSVTRRSRSP